ncbi:MAG: hypothetical protein A2Z14_05955 [Chloroflexi bacterium RBG_16_48_8]|nr:MAG: hypothetical protein A2Z14_05955 [Chloroflexi bacterium RBG_16_48_8]
MSVFVTYSRVGENQCEVKVTSADISDPYVSYGIGSTGSPYGDGNGYVRLIANTSTKDLTGSPSYTSPYGPFSGTYYGALILDAIGPDTPINTTVEVRDNAGNKTSKSDTNVGCQGSSGG